MLALLQPLDFLVHLHLLHPFIISLRRVEMLFPQRAMVAITMISMRIMVPIVRHGWSERIVVRVRLVVVVVHVITPLLDATLTCDDSFVVGFPAHGCFSDTAIRLTPFARHHNASQCTIAAHADAARPGHR